MHFLETGNGDSKWDDLREKALLELTAEEAMKRTRGLGQWIVCNNTVMDTAMQINMYDLGADALSPDGPLLAERLKRAR